MNKKIFLLSIILISLNLGSSANLTLAPQTAWCYSPLDSVTTFNCLSNITNYNDNSNAPIKTGNSVESTGLVNTTWNISLQSNTLINSVIVNSSLNVQDSNKQYWSIQILNNSNNQWINISNCSYSFSDNRVYEIKLCNISMYISQASDINNLKLKALAYNTGGNKYQYIDYQSLIIDYNPDTIPPNISNYSVSPGNNSAYAPNQVYTFNATITDNTAIGSVWMEFQGANYTATNISNIYTFVKTNLAVGVYSYRWWANDTFGNINPSDLKDYTISKADNSLTLLTSSGWAYNYGTASIFTCSALNSIPNLYIDNIQVENPKTIILSAGSHNIKCNISESQNYTSEISQGVLTINKANSQTSLIFDKASPQTYNTSITPSCSAVSGMGTPLLTLNQTQITSAQPLVLGAGIWNFNCSLAESQNYTSSSNFSQFTINLLSSTTSVILNPASWTDYGNETNFSCSNSIGLETALYINGIEKNNEKSLNILRAAGIYNLNCSFAGNENYSASSEQINYTINKAPGDVKLYLNQQENNITLDYPQQYNISASTLYGSIVIYKDGIDITSSNSLNITPDRAAKIYNITAVSSGDENHSSLSLTRWLNVTLDILAPELVIASPQEGAVYGYNISIPLNFSVSDEHLVQCWYNINNGENISLLLPQGAGFGVSFLNCQNATFNVATDSNYILYLYANDSLGNTVVKNSTFSVFVGAPTIILNSPMGIYLNNHNVTFRYSPTDIDLASCELWGDFTGTFALNQTTNSPANGAENTFFLNLGDGNYKWNIKCNDSFGHSTFNGNKTFVIDTLSPNLTLTEPSGSKSSRAPIPLQFNVQDNNLNICSYKVWRGSTIEITQTTANCTQGSGSFSVTVDADFIFEFFANDLAGNFAAKNLSFSVSTSSGGNNNNNAGQGSSGSSGGGGDIVAKKKEVSTNQGSEIEISNIGDIIMQPEEKKTILVQIKNTGNSFLNKCKLSGSGEYASWIDSTETKNINIGEITDYLVSLSVPSSITEDATIYLTISCLEKEESFPINLKIQQPSLSIKISSIEKSAKNQLLVSYIASSTSSTLKPLSFKVYAESGEKISEANEELALDTSPIKKTKYLDVSKAKQGMLKISIDSGNSTIVEEYFLYGGSITGLAAFTELSPEKTYSALIIITLCITSFFIIRRIFALHRVNKLKKSIVVKNFQKR